MMRRRSRSRRWASIRASSGRSSIAGSSRRRQFRARCIRRVLDGVDLVACAQTGTGKTLAFLLPLMQRLVKARAPTGIDARADSCADARAGRADRRRVSGAGVSHEPVERGGVRRRRRRPAGARPARLGRHRRRDAGAAARSHGHERGEFRGLEVLVLDEADRMLDMGFWPSVRRIVASLPPNRQTLLFSATMSDEVAQSASQIMRAPKMIRVGRDEGLASTIEHVGHLVPRRREGRLARQVSQADARHEPGVRPHQARRRQARAQAGGGRHQVRRAARRSHAERALGRGRRLQVGPVHER